MKKNKKHNINLSNNNVNKFSGNNSFLIFDNDMKKSQNELNLNH